MPSRTLLAACLVLVLARQAMGCTQTCEDACSQDLDDCLAHAPPGAARADCQTQYQQCLDTCSASVEGSAPAP